MAHSRVTAAVTDAPAARLPRAFYERDTPSVARALLGRRLVRRLNNAPTDGPPTYMSGLICETEAYGGPDDESSHAFRLTPRSAIMYGTPGLAYVYRIYGMHHCLNTVTEPDGRPGAVLIRAIYPTAGRALMAARRGPGAATHLTDGPGKLCQALAITLAHNGLDLVTDETLWIETGELAPEAEVMVTARIGVRGSQAARSRPWRYVWQPQGEGRMPQAA